MKISIVGGGGRVGLPLAISLVNSGNHVTIVDSDESRVNLINQRVMPFNEKGAQQALSALSFDVLNATTSTDAIKSCEICILIIGTPVLDNGSPSAGSLVDLVTNLLPYLKSVKLLMLRSTVYPGITQKIIEVLEYSGLQTKVSYCPERIAEGVALEEIRTLPQVIGANDQVSSDLSVKVFNGVCNSFIEVSILEAELTKLFANTFRYIKFAIANEFFQIALNYNANWESVWKALRTDYPRAKDLPLPGFAAGPCLVKDTMQLNYFVENKFKLGKAALEINEYLPDFLVTKLEKLYNLNDMTIGILGMTFKGNVDDFRSSLSFKLKKILQVKCRLVLCSDALLSKEYFVTSEQLIEKSDLIIIASPHDEYKSLVYSKPLVDIWRVTGQSSLI